MKRHPTDPAPALDCDVSALRAKTGMLQKLNVALATSKAAGQSLIKVSEEQIQAEANIAITSLKLAEASIRASLVGSAMPQIGALTTRVNAATASVDQALTNGAAGEVYTHFSNRAANLTLFDELLKEGKITPQEAEILISFANADAAEDINRSRLRKDEAKEAVAALSGFAIAGIEASKNRLLGG